MDLFSGERNTHKLDIAGRTRPPWGGVGWSNLTADEPPGGKRGAGPSQMGEWWVVTHSPPRDDWSRREGWTTTPGKVVGTMDSNHLPSKPSNLALNAGANLAAYSALAME